MASAGHLPRGNAFSDPKPGSISSLRCQKSRKRVRKDGACEVLFLADDNLAIGVSPSSPRRRPSGYAGLRHA